MIEEEVRRGGVAISLDDLMGGWLVQIGGQARRQAVRGSGLHRLSVGHRRVNQFALSDHWRELDEDEAKRLVSWRSCRRHRVRACRPSRQVKVGERPRTVRRAPSLPPWQVVGW